MVTKAAKTDPARAGASVVLAKPADIVTATAAIASSKSASAKSASAKSATSPKATGVASDVDVGYDKRAGNAAPLVKPEGGKPSSLLAVRAKVPVTVQQQYSSWAVKYDAETASYGWSAPQHLLNALATVAPPRGAQRVLDVGVGTGLASVPYLDAHAQVTGVDISDAMLAQANDNHPGFHHLARYSVDEPLSAAGLTPNSFDVVLSSGVLHFANDLPWTLTQLASAVASAGTLAFTYIPPQPRKFGASTKLHTQDSIDGHLRGLGLKILVSKDFVAYHDKGDPDDPVHYVLVVAQKPGAPAVLPEHLDRTACVDRARIADVFASSVPHGPQATQWTDAATAHEQNQALWLAAQAQVAAGDVDVTKLPFPTVTAEVARAQAAGIDTLAILAHPDDESVYTGGTITALTAAGKSVNLLSATNGGGGRAAAGVDLVKLRAKELEQAAAQLGIGQVTTLDFKDIGKYRDDQRAVPLTAADTLKAWGLADIVGSFVKSIRAQRPLALLSFDPTRDPNYSLHGHHLAVGTAVALAVHLAADGAFFPEHGAPWAVQRHDVVVPNDAKSTLPLTHISVDAARKRAALQAHGSQPFSLASATSAPGAVESWSHFFARVDADATADAKSVNSTDTTALTLPTTLLQDLRAAKNATIEQLYHTRSVPQTHADAVNRPIARAQLVELITDQAQRYGALTPAQHANLALLAKDGTATVVTGQQTAVMGGPLYSLFKALGAVARAQELTAQGLPSVPVFWMASYDADLKEVQEVKALGDTEVKTLTLKLRQQDKPVGTIKLGDGATRMLDEMDAVLTNTQAPHKDAALALARTCFTADATFADAFGRFIFALTQQHGLLVLDPNDRRFSALARPVLERELFADTSSQTRVDAAVALLQAQNVEPQVHSTSDRLNVFFVDDNGQRVFVKRTADGFVTGGTPATLSHAQARQLLDDAPERFTPSALLRPVVQDAVLPTVSYIGGPSEVAYYAQIGGVYDWAGVPMPSVQARPSFAFAHRRDVDALEHVTGLPIAVLLEHPTPHELIGRAALPAAVRAAYDRVAKVRNSVDATIERITAAVHDKNADGVQAEFDALMATVRAAMNDASACAQTASLQRCVDGIKGAAQKLDHVAQQLTASVQRMRTDPHYAPTTSAVGKVGAELSALVAQSVKVGRQARPELVRAFNQLLPGGAPQERSMSLVQLVAEVGTDAAALFLPHAQVDGAQRHLVKVD